MKTKTTLPDRHPLQSDDAYHLDLRISGLMFLDKDDDTSYQALDDSLHALLDRLDVPIHEGNYTLIVSALNVANLNGQNRSLGVDWYSKDFDPAHYVSAGEDDYGDPIDPADAPEGAELAINYHALAEAIHIYQCDALLILRLYDNVTNTLLDSGAVIYAPN